jgi:hypothetical protein
MEAFVNRLAQRDVGRLFPMTSTGLLWARKR